MENKMVPKYLAACKLAGMSEGSIKMAAATLESFAEYCKKQAQAKKEKERLRSRFLLEGRGRV